MQNLHWIDNTNYLMPAMTSEAAQVYKPVEWTWQAEDTSGSARKRGQPSRIAMEYSHFAEQAKTGHLALFTKWYTAPRHYHSSSRLQTSMDAPADRRVRYQDAGGRVRDRPSPNDQNCALDTLEMSRITGKSDRKPPSPDLFTSAAGDA
ncbi:hypothetical protein Q7P36_006726 [Cladosporium allicinum]